MTSVLSILPTLIVVILMLSGTKSLAAGAPNFARLPELNLTHPYCEGAMNLDMSSEYFVEISNELPGREAYNQLIQIYRRKDWNRLEGEIEKFRKVYESSPLLEAIAFLEVQVAFEKIDHDGTVQLRDAEKKLRGVLVLYPKSTLVPVASASVASFWLRHQQFAKALALYEVARREHSGHELACAFILGSGEANYQLRDWTAAKEAFAQVLKDCRNPRLITGALIRGADMILEKNPKEAKAVYEKVFAQNGPIVNHFYSMLLYNLGEMKYREKQFPSAKFYFNEYLRQKHKVENCKAYSLKRMADIAFQNKNKLEDAIGLYFSVKEEVPLNDISRFSYLHGLLLDFKNSSEAEQERRLKIVDAELEKITDEQLRNVGFLEKGLALLEVGEKPALDYLVRLNEKTQFNLDKGDIAVFVRDHLMEILEKDAEGAVAKNIRKEAVKDQQVFTPIEAAFPIWLKDSSYEQRAKKLYAKLVLRRYEESLGRKKFSAALDKLDRWKKSALWPEKGPRPEVQFAVSKSFTSYFSALSGEELFEAAAVARAKEPALQSFLIGDYTTLFGSFLRLVKDQTRLTAWLDKEGKNRQIAGAITKVPNDLQSYLWNERGLNYWAIKRFKEADDAFKRVTEASYKIKAQQNRLRLYTEAEMFANAVDIGLQAVSNFEEEDQEEFAQLTIEAAKKAKAWKKGDALTSMAEKLDLDDSLLSDFYYFAGRSSFELNRCRNSVRDYKKAFTLKAETPEKIENKFRLGKCLLKEKKTIEAQKAWEEVVAAKDSFWSPLAQNELSLLGVK